ncbi:hypothetical protein LXL04_001658 [Taraxacum kok-saghyz]
MHHAQKPNQIHSFEIQVRRLHLHDLYSSLSALNSPIDATAMGEVDPTFIQQLEHRPKLEVTEAQGIPQIDLSPLLNSSDPAEVHADLVAQVREACENWGFFQVFNHGIPVESREKLMAAAKRFFNQPVEEKRKVRRDEAHPLGYYDTEHTKNVRDWKEVFDVTVDVPTMMWASHEPDDHQLTEYLNQWPHHLPELRAACEEYVKDVQKLSYKLLELIAFSLNIPANRFESFFSKGQTSFIRLNHYPPCPAPDLALGVGQHKDAIALTILTQDDVGGLEVKRKTDGEWIFVKPTPNTFIINVGDMIQVWSNDKLLHFTSHHPPPFKFTTFSILNSSFISMGEVDPTFIQELEHRPKLAVLEAEGIPQIDLSPFINSTPSDGNAAAIEDLINQVRDACKNWGFFEVINHGVPVDVREKLQSAAKRFFDQILEEKKKVRRGEANPFGYYDTEHTKNVRDWKEVFDFTVEVPTLMPASYESDDEQTAEYSNQWPNHPPELREASEEYVKEVEKLSYKLLELISLSLNLHSNRLNPFFKDQTSFVRLNHYPPCPAPDLALGVGRHKDAGALTILAQDDVGGLEVKRKSDGEWIFVNPTPNSFIINVGDIIQVWSNDRYESVEHRVKVNAGRERFSIPFFVNPAHYTVVEPLAELTEEGNSAKYRSYNWGKFFVTRKRSNFKKLDVENIQIYHFKKPDKLKLENVVSVVENVV